MATPTPSAEFLQESRVPQILFGTIFPAVVATIAVLGRFYSRAIILKVWGLDDTLILISWLSGCVVILTLNMLLVHFGAGRHIQLFTLNDATQAMKLGFVCKMLYTFTLGTTKLGVCAFYTRIFPDRKSRMVMYTIATFIVLSTIPIMVAHVTRCNPSSGAWTLVQENCHFEPPIVISSAVFNILGDVALLGFVLPKIAKLQIATRQKISLMGVLAISVLIIVAAIVRVVRVTFEITSEVDIPYVSYDVTIWTSVEINTGLFCASAPSLKPLLQKLVPGILTSVRSSKAGSKWGTYGGDTTQSRRRAPDAFELSSQTNLGALSRSEGQIYNGGKDHEGHKTSFSDAGSEKVEADQGVGKGDTVIRKTIEVSISHSSNFEVERNATNRSFLRD